MEEVTVVEEMNTESENIPYPIKIVFISEVTGVECSKTLNINEVNILIQFSEYFKTLIDTTTEASNIISLIESDPNQALKLLLEIITNNTISDWDSYNATLCSKWLIDSYVNKYKEIAETNLKDIFQFSRNKNSSLLLYGCNKITSGCYDLQYLLTDSFSGVFTNRDYPDLRIELSKDTSRFYLNYYGYRNTYSSLQFKSEHESNPHICTCNFNRGLKVKLVPPIKQLTLFWNTLKTISTHQHAYGNIISITPRQKLIQYLKFHKEVWFVEEMKNIFSIDEAFEIFKGEWSND